MALWRSLRMEVRMSVCVCAYVCAWYVVYIRPCACVHVCVCQSLKEMFSSLMVVFTLSEHEWAELAVQNALLQSMISLRLCVQLVTRCALWTWDPMLTFAKDAVAYLCRAIVALLHSMPELKFSPLELAACFQIIDAIKQATIVCAIQGSEQKPATSLLSVLCLMLAMMGWHVP